MARQIFHSRSLLKNSASLFAANRRAGKTAMGPGLNGGRGEFRLVFLFFSFFLARFFRDDSLMEDRNAVCVTNEQNAYSARK